MPKQKGGCEMTTSDKTIPGVYYEEIEDSAVDIQALPSGIIGIVGTADAGPLNTPTKLNSWEEFIATFGGWRDELTGPKSFMAARRQGATSIYFSRIASSTKAQAAADFYQSGAAKAAITLAARCVKSDNTTISPAVCGYLELQNSTPATVVRLTALEAGVSEEAINITITSGNPSGYSNVVIAKSGFTSEAYANVRVKSGDAFDLVTLINQNSKLVRATRVLDDQTLANISAVALDNAVDGTVNSVKFEAKQSGTAGNNIDVKVTHGTDVGYVDIQVISGSLTELYENVRVNGNGNRNLVAVINASSAIVTVTQIADPSYGQEGNPKTGTYDLAAGTDATKAFTLTANDYGKWGNSLRLTIEAAVPTGYNVTLLEGSTVLEQFTKVAYDDIVTTLNTSNYVTATAGTLGALEVVSRVALVSGDNGATTADADYIGTTLANGTKTGILALGDIDEITIMIAAQQSSSAINQALVALAEEKGDRIAVISLPRTSSDLDVIEAAAIQTDSKVAVQAWPWKIVSHPVTSEDLILSPAEFLAGTIAAGSINASPSNKAIKWAYRDEIEYSPMSNEIARLINARVVPAARKRSTLNPTGRYVWMAGITTSTSTQNKDKQVAIIMPYLNIVEGLIEGLDPFVSELNTPYLRASIRYSANNYLKNFVKNGTLTKFAFICDGTNNTDADARNGYLYCDVELYFAYPADKIILRVKKDPSGTISAAA